MAELFGKADRLHRAVAGGSMHLVDMSAKLPRLQRDRRRRARVWPWARPSAMKMQGERRVAVGYFGDGGANTGRTWEFINLAVAVEAAADRDLREQPVRRGDPHLAGHGRRTRSPQRASRLRPAGDHGRRAGRRRRQRGGPRGPGPGARRRRSDLHRGADLPLRGSQRRRQPELPREERSRRLARARATRSTGCDGGWSTRCAGRRGLSPPPSSAAEEVVEDAIAFAEASPWPDPATVDRAWPPAGRIGGQPMSEPPDLQPGLSRRPGRGDGQERPDLRDGHGHPAPRRSLRPGARARARRSAPSGSATYRSPRPRWSPPVWASAIGGMRPIVDLNFQDFAFGAHGRAVQPGGQDPLHVRRARADGDPRHQRHRLRRGSAQQRDRVLVRRAARPQRRRTGHAGRRQGPDQDRAAPWTTRCCS